MRGVFKFSNARLRVALGCVLALGSGGLTRAVRGADESPALPTAGAPTLWRHEDWLAGLRHRGLDLRDPAAVFGAVFAQLPDAVRVEPTENYYYWHLTADGRALQGNIRLAVGARERGELAFAYGEPREFLDETGRAERLAVSKSFNASDGVRVRARDAFTVDVSHRGKTVVFHLNRLAQELPPGFRLAPGETFRQRVQDESGLRFLLLYQPDGRYFIWVLDEAEPAPEHFRELAPDVVVGRRTGFVFWVQESLGGRKVLASVQRASLERNDYHDGPFDQLADNFVQGDGLRPFLEQAMPWLQGRVDPWGNITDGPAPRRVALTVHGTHDQPAEAVALTAEAKKRRDPMAHLSRGGRVADGTPGGETGAPR
jgi:hypothetical protein